MRFCCVRMLWKVSCPAWTRHAVLLQESFCKDEVDRSVDVCRFRTRDNRRRLDPAPQPVAGKRNVPLVRVVPGRPGGKPSQDWQPRYSHGPGSKQLNHRSLDNIACLGSELALGLRLEQMSSLGLFDAWRRQGYEKVRKTVDIKSMIAYTPNTLSSVRTFGLWQDAA